MAIDSYYTLGRSGLRVSRLALGSMTFGTEWGWGTDEATARQMVEAYLDAGGNVIDTADLYTNGTSETWLGRFIADCRALDRVVRPFGSKAAARAWDKCEAGGCARRTRRPEGPSS